MLCLAGPWKVLQRWLTDSVVYNEWMNPIDYETEEALAEQEAAGRQLPGDSSTFQGSKTYCPTVAGCLSLRQWLICTWAALSCLTWRMWHVSGINCRAGASPAHAQMHESRYVTALTVLITMKCYHVSAQR